MARNPAISPVRSPGTGAERGSATARVAAPSALAGRVTRAGAAALLSPPSLHAVTQALKRRRIMAMLRLQARPRLDGSVVGVGRVVTPCCRPLPARLPWGQRWSL